MGDVIQLKRGSYRGVEFLFVESGTNGGNRIIRYQYPGSDNQSIEYQGKARRSFDMTIWVPHEDYYAKRDDILRVLEDGTKGTLVHPTFGAIENVIGGRYTLAERNSELGRASITVTFEIDDGDGIPVEAASLASQVAAEAESLNAILSDDLANTFQVTASFTGNFQDAFDDLSSLVDAITSAIDQVTPAIDTAAEFAQEVKGLYSDILNLIQTPRELANRVTDIFVSLDSYLETDSTSDPSGTAGVFVNLFTFGDSDPVVNETTAGRIERAENRKRVRAMIKTMALSHAYTNYSLVEYDTTETLNAAQSILEAQYIDCRTNQLLTNGAIEQLDRLRVQAQKYFDDIQVNTRSILTVEVYPPTPLSVIVYRYYGATDLVDTIAELNNIDMNAFVSGELRILTA